MSAARLSGVRPRPNTRRGLQRPSGERAARAAARPGLLRAAWMTVVGAAFAFGLVVGLRALQDLPVWRATPIVTVILLAAPLGFLVGIGGFDYWGKWMIGSPTEPEDHSEPRRAQLADYFRVNTDHKVIGIQYTVTALFFLLVGGALAEVMRAELAQPGQQVVDSNTFNGLFSVHAVADDLPGHHPDLRGARELRDPAHDRRARHGVPAPERAQLLAAAGRRAS